MRCNELCTKEATGQCTHCDALAERERFERHFWAVVEACSQGCRWLRTHARLVSLIILSILTPLFLVSLIYAWGLQRNPPDQSLTCSVGFRPLQEHNGYLQIQLIEHHPSEPVFSGKLFFLSVNPSDKEVSTVTVTRSKQRSYASSTHDIKTIWDKNLNALRPLQGEEELLLVMETGSHQDFPYDSARFDFVLDINPPIDFRVIRIVNRVPGFTMNCRTLQASRPNTRTLQINFNVERGLIIQLFAIILLVASIGFLVLIFLTAQLTNFATSMASFFLAFWSLRRMLEPLIKTFPTLLDHWMLTICILALLGAGWKVYFLKRPESGV